MSPLYKGVLVTVALVTYVVGASVWVLGVVAAATYVIHETWYAL